MLTVLADKEETGSDGNTGLNSSFMRYFIADLAQAEGLEVRHVLSKSKCLSADVTAAYDPTYASAYEAGNACYVNNGVGMSKYTGARGKSGTSDASAEFVGEIRALFDKNEVLWQIGEMGRDGSLRRRNGCAVCRKSGCRRRRCRRAGALDACSV